MLLLLVCLNKLSSFPILCPALAALELCKWFASMISLLRQCEETELSCDEWLTRPCESCESHKVFPRLAESLGSCLGLFSFRFRGSQMPGESLLFRRGFLRMMTSLMCLRFFGGDLKFGSDELDRFIFLSNAPTPLLLPGAWYGCQVVLCKAELSGVQFSCEELLVFSCLMGPYIRKMWNFKIVITYKHIDWPFQSKFNYPKSRLIEHNIGHSAWYWLCGWEWSFEPVGW